MNTFARCFAIVVAPVDLLELPAWESGTSPRQPGIFGGIGGFAAQLLQ